MTVLALAFFVFFFLLYLLVLPEPPLPLLQVVLFKFPRVSLEHPAGDIFDIFKLVQVFDHIGIKPSHGENQMVSMAHSTGGWQNITTG